MREAETLPFIKKNPVAIWAEFFCLEIGKHPQLIPRPPKDADNRSAPKTFFQEKSENSTFSYLDHQNRETEVQEMNDRTIE